jgi:transcriptional regulator with GAF, ATPase, and Fis domain
MDRSLAVLIALLPPPISLNTLCTLTGEGPVEVLQRVEELVKSGYLLKYKEKGAGYYYLADYKAAKKSLSAIPQATLFSAAEQAIAGVCKNMPDGAQRWLNLAHIYQVSGLPLAHCHELVQAGHYCLGLNLPIDAAAYYRMALEGMARAELGTKEQQCFIDAAIGICTCRDSALPPEIQRNFLSRALQLATSGNDPVLEIRLRVLIAKTFIKTSRSAEAAGHLERAWQMLADHEIPNDVRLQVALANSELLFWQGFITKAIERYESVIGNHEELPSDVETLKSCIRLGWIYGVAGETARGVGLLKTVCRKAGELNAPDLDRHAKLILVLILGDAGRIDEGETILEEIFQTPEELLDHYFLWPGNGKRAYFAYCRGNYQKAFEYLSLAWENSKALGTPHHRGPDNLEVMLGLEERGMVHPEWNFQSDIEQLLDWPDIYMQGVALRFRALKAYKQRESLASIEADLQKSMTLLTQAGAKIELAHTQILLARIRLSEKNCADAEKLLKEAWETFAKVNPNLFPKDLKSSLDRASKHAFWVESLVKVGDALGSIRSRNELLSQIIMQAVRIAGAERGAIFLQQDKQLEMVASRNLEPPDASPEAFAYQRGLIEQVFHTGTEIVKEADIYGLADKAELGSLSAQTNHMPLRYQGYLTAVGWTGCFPIRLKAKVMGVIFMDGGPTRLQLPEDEISLLRIIANQAAVALQNLEAYEEIVDLKSSLEAEANYYREAFEPSLLKTPMIGRAEPFKQLLNLISRVAKSDTTVMITGETGVGKDLVAQAIHQNSNRAAGPFIAVNVVSLSPELIASELFGHEKGAFTGATGAREGRFELASRGTLFLDDIDAFSLDIQAKMLRVLEAREFERVGGTQTIKTRFRLLAASNRNIEELVEKGLFRSDFYYRLNVFPIKVPALRERADDIPALARYFLEIFGKKFGKQFDRIAKKELELLMSYHWPGNIRELRHVIERAVLLSKNGQLHIPPLDTSPLRIAGKEEKILPLREMEARHILSALARCRGKVTGKGGAAELLEVKPTTLHSMMLRLGIKRDAYKIG